MTALVNGAEIIGSLILGNRSSHSVFEMVFFSYNTDISFKLLPFKAASQGPAAMCNFITQDTRSFADVLFGLSNREIIQEKRRGKVTGNREN